MSAFGTKRTSRCVRPMSAMRGKADIPSTSLRPRLTHSEENSMMTLKEAADHCETAWSAYAHRHGIRRDGDEFYLLKMQEELDELSRHWLEMTKGEHTREDEPTLRPKYEGDCASLVGNALILARHFDVDLDQRIVEKFPVAAR